MARWPSSSPKQSGPDIVAGPPHMRRVMRVYVDREKCTVQIEEYAGRDVDCGAEIALPQDKLEEVISRLMGVLRQMKGIE